MLVRAARIAARRGETSVEVEHLLVALVEDESSGAEVLAGFGFAAGDAAALLAVRRDDTGSTPPITPAESGDVRLVRLEAARFARLAGGDATVGSEHLLFALAVVPSNVAEVLGEHGLDEAAVMGFANREVPATGEPLAVEFALEFGAPTIARDELVDQTPGVSEDIECLLALDADRVRIPASSENPGFRECDATSALDVHRIVDAAANRAREGLRVAEDHVRFVLDDGHLVGLLKSCRHDLAAALSAFDRTALVRARDTTGDVGTAISTAAEGRRDSADDVLRAALGRTGEALRTLEEFGKVLAADAGPRFEQLRYRLYTIEKAVILTTAARATLAGRNLYLLLTRDLCRREPEFVVREAIRGGVSIVQLREKSMPDRAFLDWADDVRRWTREAGAMLIVNDRPDLAVLCDADGVHVGQDELSVRQARRILGPQRLVGVSTHDVEQARRAVLDGADYLGVGPTFPSRTKSFPGFAGLAFVREVAGEIGLPWYAIGGIDTSNVGEVVAAGGRRLAVTGAICAANEPAEAAAQISSDLRAVE